MTLSPGSRLGSYEILSPLGAGGMGEVYRARDPRLGREVAIKVLPEAYVEDTDRLARFDREARSLASLNHPNVGAIYELEEAAGLRFLVLELVPGETLDERLAGGPLPLDEALRTASQIAEALEAAHEKGIVHRDLKPGNVKLTPEGRIKVLDFGLAKTLPEAPASGDGTRSPTLGADGTRSGVILGTPAYMSPEQARGRTIDKRTDIWAFGCLLYEMLSGRKAFGRDTVSDTLVAILEKEPDWSALPSSTPELILRLLGRCLEKDASRRLRDAGDARLEIEAAAAVAAARESATRPPQAGASRSVASRSLANLLRPIASLWRSPSAPEPSAVRSQPRLSQLTFAEEIEGSPEWSPAGDRVAFSREGGAVRRIFVKDLATQQESPLTHGPFDDCQAAWSPADGRVLFTRSQEPDRKLEPVDVFGQYEGADIWTIDPGTGRETRLIANAANPSFSPDGRRIAFDSSWAGPRRIWIADERGHNPQQATSDISEALVHVRPRWSPDGRRIVFQSIERTKFDIRVCDTESKSLTWVTNDYFQDICPIWSGNFIYFSSHRSGGMNLWKIPVSADGSPTGLLQQLTTGAGQDIEAAISGDGKRLVFSIVKQNADLWRLPLSDTGQPRGVPEKLVATTREDSRGAWSTDGREIAFNSDRSGEMNIWAQALPDGPARAVTRGPGGDFQPRFSLDGSRIAFFSSRAGSADIWVVERASGRMKLLTRGPSIDVNPAFSPEGKRIAFMSDRGGRLEVWVMDADGARPRQLTEVGVMGHFLLWTADGQFLVFRCPSGPATMKVSVGGGAPEPLPEVAGGSHMSFSPDQSRILDVVAHKALWVSSLTGGKPEKIFAFDDPDVRIDYPLWSPDGRWVLFDRFRPQGGDIWLMENLE